ARGAGSLDRGAVVERSLGIDPAPSGSVARERVPRRALARQWQVTHDALTRRRSPVSRGGALPSHGGAGGSAPHPPARAPAPFRPLGLALTAGYVLGGGLTPGLVRVLMVAGGRTMAGNFLTAAVRGAFDQWRMIDDTQGPFPAAWDPTPGTR